MRGNLSLIHIKMCIRDRSTTEASTADGSFHVTIEVLEEGSADATNIGGPVETRVPSITSDLLSRIPRLSLIHI